MRWQGRASIVDTKIAASLFMRQGLMWLKQIIGQTWGQENKQSGGVQKIHYTMQMIWLEGAAASGKKVYLNLSGSELGGFPIKVVYGQSCILYANPLLPVSSCQCGGLEPVATVCQSRPQSSLYTQAYMANQSSHFTMFTFTFVRICWHYANLKPYSLMFWITSVVHITVNFTAFWAKHNQCAWNW